MNLFTGIILTKDRIFCPMGLGGKQKYIELQSDLQSLDSLNNEITLIV